VTNHIMEKVRVLIVTYALQKGGMEQSLKRLIVYLKEFNIYAEILLTEEKGEWFDDFTNLCKVTCIGTSKLGVVQHLFRIGRFINKGNFDILINICDKYSQTILPYIDNKIKVVSAIRLDDPYFYHLAATNYGFVDAYIVNSKKLCLSLSDTVRSKPIFLIENGIALPDQSFISNRVAIDSPLKLLFVGRITAQKGALLLPDIVGKCLDSNLDVQLTIIGDGEQRELLLAKISKNKLDHVICYKGYMPQQELCKWYMDNHVLLFPSIGEGLPNVLLEAQGYGCVPIANRLASITDVVINNNATGFLVENNDVKSYVDKIKLMADNPDLWMEFSKNSVKWIKDNFSFEKERNAYLRLINSLNYKKIEKKIFSQLSLASFRLLTLSDFIPEFIKVIKRFIVKLCYP